MNENGAAGLTRRKALLSLLEKPEYICYLRVFVSFCLSNSTKPTANKTKKSRVKLLFRMVNVLAILTVPTCKSGYELSIFIINRFSA